MNRRLKVLQLIASSHGGGATHVQDLAALLPKAQVELTVGMPEDGGNVSRTAIEAAGAQFIPLQIQSGFKFSELKKIVSIIKNGRFDILHVHGARAGLYGRLAALLLAKRPNIIFSIHGFATPFYSFPKKQVYLLLEKLFQRITDHTICVALAEADLFLSYHLTKPAKISIIHPGIPLERFSKPIHSIERLKKQLNLTADAPTILTICRLHIPRDFETLLTAVALTKQTFPNIQLLIVGDGPLRDEIKTKISTLNLAQNVQLLGLRQDIPALISLANIYTLTSSGWEGFPISTIEAQAMGCPVVITDAGGSSEAVQHEETGLVVPIGNAKALADAYIKLLKNKSLRNKFGRRGKEWVHQSLSSQTMIEKINRIYRSQIERAAT